jgi:glyoxylate/hydroxypyruvate reductase
LSQVSRLEPRKIVAGFLGFGRISQATLHRLVAFGITDVVFYTRSPYSPQRREALLKKYPSIKTLNQVPLEDVAKESDVVFVLTPGGSTTYHLVNSDFLKLMKKEAVLVNTSRGTVVDSDALARALREKWIWGAGLDVVEGEPNIEADHPLLREPRYSVNLSP